MLNDVATIKQLSIVRRVTVSFSRNYKMADNPSTDCYNSHSNPNTPSPWDKYGMRSEMEKYVSALQRNSLEFEEHIVPVREFVNGPNHVLLHIEKHTSVGMLKVYKIIQSPKLDTDYHCIFLNIDHILQTKILDYCRNNVTTKHVIVIECNGNIDKTLTDYLSTLSTIVRSNCNWKLIVVSSGGSGMEWSDVIGQCEHSNHDGISLSDLSLDQRRDIIGRKLISLQGKHISLAQINPELQLSIHKHSAQLTHNVEKLLQDVISTELLVKLGENETIEVDKSNIIIPQKLYIERTIESEMPVILKPIYLKSTFEYEHEIFAISNIKKEDLPKLSKDENEIGLYRDLKDNQNNREFNHDQIRFVILDFDDAAIQFRDLCAIYKTRNVHWLMAVTDGDSNTNKELLDVVSGLLSKSINMFDQVMASDYDSLADKYDIEEDVALIVIRSRIYGKQYEPRYTEFISVKFKESNSSPSWQIFSGTIPRVNAIVGPIGMGKSSFVKNRLNEIKTEDESLWVCNIDFVHSITKLSKLAEQLDENEHETTDRDLVIEFMISVLGLKSDFEMQLFKYYLDEHKVVLFFDGCDVLSNIYNKAVLKIINTLKNETNIKQIWLSLRPYGELYSKLNCRNSVLMKLSKKEQKILLCNYLKQKLECSEVEEVELKNLVKKVLKLISKLDYYYKMTGFPLISRMLADILLAKISESEENRKSLNEIPLERSSIYEQIIQKIYFEVYLGQNSEQNDESKMNFDEYLHAHELIALYNLMKDNLLNENILSETEAITLNKLVQSIETEQEKTGIIYDNISGVPQFIHETLAEYFATVWFINQLKGDYKDENILVRCFFKYVLDDRCLVSLRLIQREPMTCPGEPISIVLRKLTDTKHDNNSLLHKAIDLEQMTLITSILDQLSDERLKTQIFEEELMHLAAKRDVKIVELLLERLKISFPLEIDSFVNKESIQFESPLHEAADSNNIDVVKLLIANGAKQWHKRLRDAYTPLDVAFSYGYAEIVEFLLKNHASCVKSDAISNNEAESNVSEDMNTLLSHQLSNGNTLLHSAIVIERLKVVKTLLELNPPLNIKNVKGFTPLSSAVNHPNVDALKLILDKQTNDVDDVIYSAGIIKEIGMIEMFVESIQRHFPNHLTRFLNHTNTKGDTLLHIAVELNDKTAVESLIKLGAPIDMRNDKGHTPLSSAVAKDNADLVAMILNSVTTYDVIAHAAAYINCGQIVMFIIGHVANHYSDKLTCLLDQKYENDNTLVHIAAIDDHMDALDLLIENGAKVNIKNKYKQTPLHSAVKCSKNNIVKQLLENLSTPILDIIDCLNILIDEEIAIQFIDLVEKRFPNDLKSFINHKLRCGYTLAHMAARSNWSRTVERLLSLETDFGATNKDGRTPLCVALLHGSTAVVSLLIRQHNIADQLKYSLELRNKEISEVKAKGNRRKFPMDLPKAIDNYKHGNTLLHIASSNCYELIKLLLDVGGDTKVRNLNNETPLDIRCFDNITDGLKLLVSKITIEKSENIFKSLGNIRKFSRCAFECLRDYNPDLFQKLIRYRDENGDTILHVISGKTFNEIENAKAAEFLIGEGAKVNIKNMHEESPLFLACQQRCVKLAKVFLENGAIVDDQYKLRLIYEIPYEELDILKLLLENGVCLKVVLSDTVIGVVLHLCAERGKFDLVKLLVFNGAPVNAREYYHRTPLHMLQHYEVNRENVHIYLEMVMFLIKAGSDIMARNDDEVTAIEQIWSKSAMQSTHRVKLMHSIVLFSVDNIEDSEQLKMIESLIGDSFGLQRCLHYIVQHKTLVSETFACVDHLIRACKEQNELHICQHLDEMLADEDTLNHTLHSLNHIEIPVHDYISTKLLRLCNVNIEQMIFDFITYSIARLTKHYIETSGEMKAFDRLTISKNHCEQYFVNKNKHSYD